MYLSLILMTINVIGRPGADGIGSSYPEAPAEAGSAGILLTSARGGGAGMACGCSREGGEEYPVAVHQVLMDWPPS